MFFYEGLPMKVSNPLTIVAIFASVAEAFATGALILLPDAMQAKFIYFVIFFPILIVVSFFLTLWLKPQVLYAPSDFSNEEHFLQANKLKKIMAFETEKALNEEKTRYKIKGDLKELSKKVAEKAVKGLEDIADEQVIEYMLKHPRQGYTDSGLGHILLTSRSEILNSLNRLEKKGRIESGMDGETKIWQAKT
jgi:hypothetical protein